MTEGKKSSSGPRKRAATSRSRNGCFTWTRRIKCDEARPSCQKCRSSGWNCEGYSVLNPQKQPLASILPRTGGVAIAPRRYIAIDPISARKPPSLSFSNSSSVSPRPCITPPPPNSFFQTAEEYQYFNRFETKTASELCGVFHTELWGHLVLQASHKEDFVKHAVIAIAALDMESHASPISTFQSYRSHHEFALQQYSKALKLMRRTKPLNEDESTRNMLLACLLTICFENFHGSITNGLAQAQLGAGLYSRWLENEVRKGAKIKSRISPRPEAIETELLCTFARFDLHFKMMSMEVGGRDYIPQRKLDLQALEEMPSLFVDIDQAKYYFELINRLSMSQCLTLSRRKAKSAMDLINMSDVVKIERLSITPEEEELLSTEPTEASLNKLWHAFLPLLRHSRTPEGSDSYLATTTLLLHKEAYPFINRSTFNFNSECWYDGMLDKMRTCVKLLREVLKFDQGPLKAEKDARRTYSFTFEVHYLPVLYAIVIKCRNHDLRREAIRLFESYPSIRQGFWCSEMAIAISRHFMELEEEGLPYGAFIPEHRRLSIVKQELVLSQRMIVYTCSRGMEVLPKIVIRW